ncbi:MAG: histidine phosphatase family protein [Ruminococcus sp.]|nr:histidine phosphatase family protein [Ruminococcus sp.]
MTTVYFVRHAQPDPSSGNNPEFPLTAQGQKDALLVRDVLGDKDIRAVYSSSYIRAVMTVEPFAQSKGLEVIKEYGLRERTAGKWQDGFADYAEYISRQINDYSCKAEGGESLDEVQQRCMAVVSRIVDAHDGEAVAVGIHGMALSTVLKYFFPHFGERDFLQIVDLMPLVLRLDIEDGKAVKYGIELAVRRDYPNSYLKM